MKASGILISPFLTAAWCRKLIISPMAYDALREEHAALREQTEELRESTAKQIDDLREQNQVLLRHGPPHPWSL